MRKMFQILRFILCWCLIITACSSPGVTISGNTGSSTTTPGVTATPGPSPTVTITPTSTPVGLPGSTFPIRLAWFYKPPADGNLALIANNYGFFIMSRGNEAIRDQLLAMGAAKPVLQYMRFEAIMDPGSCLHTPWQNNVAFMAGDFCSISAQHPDWFLLDTQKQRIIDPYGGENFVMMDPGNQGWRDFFLQRLHQMQDSDPNWGGVFFDNVEVTMARLQRDGRIPANYPDDASYQAAVQGFLKYLSVNYFKPSGKLIFANLVSRRDDGDWTNYLTYLDGAMHEGWAIDWPNGYRPADVWAKQMALAEQTQKMGKFIILVSQGTQANQELQKFAYASYLLVNQGRAAFRYANGQYYNQAWLYDNYKINLGDALGTRYPVGNAWKRDFVNGFVLVNPVTHEVQINIAP